MATECENKSDKNPEEKNWFMNWLLKTVRRSSFLNVIAFCIVIFISFNKSPADFARFGFWGLAIFAILMSFSP